MHQLALQVRDLIQVKVGVSELSAMWESLRQSSREKRESRRAARKHLVSYRADRKACRLTRQPVADPEAWAAQRERRGLAKKALKKKKTAAFA